MHRSDRDERGLLWRQLVRAMPGTIGVRAVVTALSLSSGLVLARLLGAEAYGDYAYATTIVILLSFLAPLGTSGLAAREIPRNRVSGNWGLLQGFLRHAHGVSLVAAFVLAGATACFFVLFPPSSLQPQSITTVLLVTVSLPLFALIRLKRGVLIGLAQPVYAQIPHEIALPAFVIALAGVLRVTGHTSSIAAGGAYVIAILLSFGIAAELTRRASRGMPHGTLERTRRAWAKASFWFLAINVSAILSQRVSTFLLGTMLTTLEAGIFGVIFRLGNLISFVHIAVHIPVHPLAARLHEEGRLDDMHWVGVRSARVALVGALIVGAVYVFFGRAILGWYGPEFVVAHRALLIITGGEIYNVACGAVGVFLCMSGYARDTAIAGAAAGVLNVALAILLIPRHGVIGAAVGASLATALWNTLMLWWIYRRLGIVVAAFMPSRRIWVHS